MSNEDKVIAEFDDYSLGQAKLVLRVADVAVDQLVVHTDKTEFVVVDAIRDQWGVWYRLSDVQLAHQDGDRSPIDAIIRGLQLLKQRNELCEDGE